MQCACVFPPLITVLPTDNLAITSQGGSMELMLKLVGFFFLLFKLQCVMRQRGRREGEGSHKFCGWCSCSLSSREASDVPTALSLTFKLRVCFPVCFIGRDLSWPVTCSTPLPPSPKQVCNCSHCCILTLGCSWSSKGIPRDGALEVQGVTVRMWVFLPE